MNTKQVINDINKKMKLGNISLGVAYQQLDRIPFSSCRLNYMTYGGVPVGRIIEFSGSDGSGKTTTALDVVGNAQKKFKNKKVLFVDIEHTFDSEWATKLGVNVDDILYYDPDSSSAEDVFNTIVKLVDDADISLVVLDSIGAMVSGQANEKQIGERTYGGISMALTEFAKKITPVLARNKCTLIGINQIRDDMNSQWGGTTTTGGRSWRHSCSMRIDFRKGKYIDEKGSSLTNSCENPAGNLVNVALIKSKVNRLDRKVGFYSLNYLNGIDYVSDAVDVAIKYGVVNQRGAWFDIVDAKTGELLQQNGEEMKFNGKPKLVEALRENADLYGVLLDGINYLEENKN